jgi:hypothetical protein
VATASETIETLSAVRRDHDRIGQGQHAKIRILALEVPDPGATRLQPVAQRLDDGGIGAAGWGEHQPHTVPLHHRRELTRKSLTDRTVEPVAAVGPADQHRDERARERGDPVAPGVGRDGEPRGRHAMQGGAGDHDIRAGQIVMARDNDQVEAARVHARMLHLHHRHPALPQRRNHRGRLPPSANRDLGQLALNCIRHHGQRRRP